MERSEKRCWKVRHPSENAAGWGCGTRVKGRLNDDDLGRMPDAGNGTWICESVCGITILQKLGNTPMSPSPNDIPPPSRPLMAAHLGDDR